MESVGNILLKKLDLMFILVSNITYIMAENKIDGEMYPYKKFSKNKTLGCCIPNSGM